jgi:hypothetical protein
MPMQSEAQRRWMHANEPEMARRWEKKTPKGKDLPERVAKINGKKLRDVVRLAKVHGSMLAMMTEHKNGYALHTLIFDKRAFPKQDDVRNWLRKKDHLGAKLGAIADVSGEWHVRQGSPDTTGLEDKRVRCDIGVQAIIGMPRAIQKGGPVGGNPQQIGVTVRPETTMPHFPDWEMWFSPEAKKKQDKEAEQSKDRRRSMWRDLNFSGIHGVKNDKPEVRYKYGESSTGDVATTPVHYLTVAQLRKDKKRITDGVGINYERVQGKTKRK